MMRGPLMLVLLTAAARAVQAAPAPPDAPKLIRLAPQSTAKQAGALHYRLLPDSLDRTSGNAAPLWRLACESLYEAKRKMTRKEESWGTEETPLKELPRKEVHAFLTAHAATLRLARAAACRDHCDWEVPPLTLQSLPEFLPQETMQRCRILTILLGIQYRLQLVEGRFEDAAETLQTGFALARHLCESDMLIQNLVGIALGAIVFGHVEEWIQTPGSPNLYWALTSLPRPFLSVRRPVEHDLNTLYRSFPRLRRLRRETLTERQAEELAKEMFDVLSKALGDDVKAKEFRKLGESIQKAEQYPQARQHLLALGRTAKELDAMPKVQVVLLWHLDQYDELRDDVLKVLALPTWQRATRMDRAMKALHAASDPTLSLLMPALSKVHEAHLRIQRHLAGLRGAEALRLYAAAHKGKPPAKWDDITEAPLPIDPATGKGFDEMYQVTEGRGVLEVPHRFVFLGRRYELASPH